MKIRQAVKIQFREMKIPIRETNWMAMEAKKMMRRP
jgi:hypothetical protein